MICDSLEQFFGILILVAISYTLTWGYLYPKFDPKPVVPGRFFQDRILGNLRSKTSLPKYRICNVDNPMIGYCWDFSIIVREFCEPQSPNHRPFTSHGNDKPMPIWGCGIWVYHIFQIESPQTHNSLAFTWGWVKTYWFSINLGGWTSICQLFFG
jgi:hypothetical protein